MLDCSLTPALYISYYGNHALPTQGLSDTIIPAQNHKYNQRNSREKSLTEPGQGHPLFAVSLFYHGPEGGFRGVELVVLFSHFQFALGIADGGNLGVIQPGHQIRQLLGGEIGL